MIWLTAMLLAGLAVIAGILALLDAARYMGWLPIAILGEMKFVLLSAQWFAALLSGMVGVIYFVGIAIINLILPFLAILGQTAFSAIALQIIVNAAASILALIPKHQGRLQYALAPRSQGICV